MPPELISNYQANLSLMQHQGSQNSLTLIYAIWIWGCNVLTDSLWRSLRWEIIQKGGWWTPLLETHQTHLIHLKSWHHIFTAIDDANSMFLFARALSKVIFKLLKQITLCLPYMNLNHERTDSGILFNERYYSNRFMTFPLHCLQRSLCKREPIMIKAYWSDFDLVFVVPQKYPEYSLWAFTHKR